ncbi:hypothetical protein BDR05DRAFT_978178 [Suillus weaverae]|nr:hypothetical protein BDR05DRAFT_978178 [Suillus weaverae]
MQPHPYCPALTPLTSALRPHCLVRDLSRSRLDHTGSEVVISKSDLDRILTVIAHSHAPSTRETYGSGLLVFHVFCNSRGILEAQCCLASSILILAFIASCMGMYSGKMLENYLYSVHTWHLLHSQPWLAHHNQVLSVLEGGKHLAPPTSTRPKCATFTVELLSNLHAAFDLTTLLHATFTVLSLQCFDPAIHVKVSDMRVETDKNGFDVTVFHLLQTKVALAGEDVYWAVQSGVIDPQAVLANHLAINKPSVSDALFSWSHQNGMRLLMRSEFLKCLQCAHNRLSGESLKGHGIHIGGTLEYLLHGVPFKSIKMMGCWSSDVFLLYDRPVLEPFMHYVLP